METYRISKLFSDFFQSEKAGGGLLVLAASISILLTNSSLGSEYMAIWNGPLLGQKLVYWINDGLMSLFFLLVGLEIERELYIGELADIRNSLLPVFAALGGMLFPAMIYLSFNSGSPQLAGFGIPMATDIAFSLGVLSLLGQRVPVGLKIFLTALAIIDDLGAIVIIAIFYNSGIQWEALCFALALIGLMLSFRYFGLQSLWVYLLPGVALWHFIHASGIHASLSGVILAFLIPFKNGGADSPSYRLQHLLHKPVAFFILPLFALANSCIVLDSVSLQALQSAPGLGVFFGLFLGKPLGILLFCYLAVRIGIARLPSSVSWIQLTGMGSLAGIGFTMSIFIALLAFEDPQLVNGIKCAIVLASLASAAGGMLLLAKVLPKQSRVPS